MLILNIPLFLIAYFKVGKKFFLNAVIGTLLLSYFLNVFADIDAITTDAINPLNRLEIRYCSIKYDAAYNKPILITRLKNPNVSIFIGIAIIFIIGLTNKFNTVITAANNIAYQKLSIEIPGI